MPQPLAILLVLLASASAGCTSGTREAAPALRAAAAATPDAVQRVPPGNLLPRRTGTGSASLGDVRVEEPATLFFRCTLGSGASVRYGDGHQQCPPSGSLLGIELSARGAVPMSVEAEAATGWEVSVESQSVQPLSSPVQG